MSYNTELQSNNDELQDILDMINSLPEAGGSGSGGNVDTCSVTINADANDKITNYMATVFQDGKFSNVFHMNHRSRPTAPITISNVVCGTTVYVSSAYSISGFTVTNCEYTIQNASSGTFEITADSGENVTIHCYDND